MKCVTCNEMLSSKKGKKEKAKVLYPGLLAMDERWNLHQMFHQQPSSVAFKTDPTDCYMSAQLASNTSWIQRIQSWT